jgi:toluene monooxygenase system protein D
MRRDSVGPVLQVGPEADAVIAAIAQLNARMELIDRGAYVRVLVPQRCVVTREAIEQRLARPFRLPRDLEAIMSSFKGRFRVTADQASWELRIP